ncbi:extracellular serine/threonine protein kinase four-jointed-like [Acanthaster planci]|uniref:Extracellular serine/threonine protein kinase four-jointed-like n=1 Tax=Acanthaster planci TaxID=133434 RepID=A0A8B8A3A1_ACAPL|nr:extracellular serine/threonine protein kinase four-jointed-like [Acanthaster planci]
MRPCSLKRCARGSMVSCLPQFLLVTGLLAIWFVATAIFPSHEHSPTSRRRYSINMEKTQKEGSKLETLIPQDDATKDSETSPRKPQETKGLTARTPVSPSKPRATVRWTNLSDDGLDRNSTPCWIDGIFWSKSTEASLQRDLMQTTATDLAKMTRQTPVLRLVPGCGHSQNRLLTFQDGRQVCCRYRNSLDLIQGEIYAYSLSQVLHIRNLPPTAVGIINASGNQWDAVGTNMTIANWLDGHQVIFTQWIPNLVPAFLPKIFQKPERRLHPLDTLSESRSQVSQLAQWSDMIVLDYLTGNMDRMVNMFVNQQWNSFIMDSPVHNLERSVVTGQLYFLDNELSFIHSYRLLERYGHFHKEMLESLCVFRLRTVNTLTRLHSEGNVWEKMWELAVSSELLETQHLPKLSRKNVNILKSRVADVLNQVKTCQQMYANRHNLTKCH